MTLVTIAAVVLIALFGAVGVNHVRYLRRLAVEVRTLMAAPQLKGNLVRGTELPPIVERYRRIAVAGRSPVRTLRLSHRGTFRLSPTATPRPIRGEQWFTSDPPGLSGRLACGWRQASGFVRAT